MEKKLMKYILPMFVIFAIMAFVNVPDQTVSGKVTSGGEPLPGVDVSIKGTNQGTVTNMKGDYSLEAAEIDTLVFSSLGYKDKVVAVSGKSTVNVKLEEE